MQQDYVLESIFKRIKRLKSFVPSKEVNQVFSDLVKFALTSEEIVNLDDNKYEFIQNSAAAAEYELEKYWAEEILNGRKLIDDFIYYENYIKLTRIEWSSLLACKLHMNHNVLFVGSGPLPLTGIILARDYGCNVTLLDVSNEAALLSQELIFKLGLSHRIKVLSGDAVDFNKYKDYDVIYLAALAGIVDGVKRKIITKIKADSKEDVHLVARSSFGNRKILYKPLTPSDIAGLDLELEVKPHNDIVNSFLILKK